MVRLQLYFFEMVVDVVDYNLTGAGLNRKYFDKFLQLSVRDVQLLKRASLGINSQKCNHRHTLQHQVDKAVAI